MSPTHNDLILLKRNLKLFFERFVDEYFFSQLKCRALEVSHKSAWVNQPLVLPKGIIPAIHAGEELTVIVDGPGLSLTHQDDILVWIVCNLALKLFSEICDHFGDHIAIL